MSHPSAAATGAISGVAHAGGAMIRKGASEVAAHPVLAAAGAATAAAGAGTMLATRGAPSGMKMKVHRGGAVTFHRRRRMHATNAKALRRALRRAYAFERIAMRTIHLLHPRKKGRFGGFKRHRRRAA